MVRVKEGEQSALELLFARWEGPLFAFFYRLGCHPTSIEDLTEEVLVAVYRRRHRYDVGRPFAPWIYGIARLVWKDHLRLHRHEMPPAVPFDAANRVPSSDRSPSDLVEAREEVEVVRRAVQDLPDEQKAVFILRHYHGLSYQEIAETLQTPLGTVKWRMHDAVRRLEASRNVSRREGG